MRPTDQTRFGASGNCLAACFATIAEVSLSAVDFSCSDAGEDWLAHANRKLAPLGLAYADFKLDKDESGRPIFGMPDGALFIGHGPTSRGPLLHAVVCRFANNRWTVAHDPHWSRAGLRELTHAGLLIKTEKGQTP